VKLRDKAVRLARSFSPRKESRKGVHLAFFHTRWLRARKKSSNLAAFAGCHDYGRRDFPASVVARLDLLHGQGCGRQESWRSRLRAWPPQIIEPVLSPFVAGLGFDSCHPRHGTCCGVQQPHPDLAVEQVEHEHSPGPGRANSRHELKVHGGVSPTGCFDLRRWLSHGTALQNAIAAFAFDWWPAWLVGLG
jgi:hypothetical protein